MLARISSAVSGASRSPGPPSNSMVEISPGTSDVCTIPPDPCMAEFTAPGSAGSAAATRPVIVASVPGNANPVRFRTTLRPPSQPTR